MSFLPEKCADHPRHHAGHCPECVAAAIDRPAYVVVPRPVRPVVWAKPPDAPTDLQQARDLIDAENEATP